MVYDIGRRFKVITDIWNANAKESVGWMTMKIDGEEEEYQKALECLSHVRAKVEPVELDVIE